jgi:PAS domain S-box-containing protein
VATNGAITSVNAANGLTHNSTRGLLEDAEGNLWVGTSSGGLHRLRPRYFKTVGAEDGLPDRIVRTVSPEGPGRIRVGTHGGGTATIESNKVVWVRPLPVDRNGSFAWSVLRDRAGRVWTGTYNSGLYVEEKGVERPFALPPGMGRTVYGLFEDSHARVWVATFPGLGVIENGVCRVWTNAPNLVTASVRCMAEEPGTGAMWIGTYDRGVYRLDATGVQPYGMAQGVPRLRISSLAYDADGAWVGLFRNGMARVKDARVTLLGANQGLPAKTIGSILDDGLGNYWLGSDRGILRVTKAELHDVVQGKRAAAQFNLFNEGDGLQNAECSEGYQPAAARDERGRLWFATLNGVVSVDPRAVRINQRPPPVFVEQATFRDDRGDRQLLMPKDGRITLPPGSTEIEITCAALSYAAPEKVRYAYQVLGSSTAWADIGNRREVYFHKPPPGELRIQIKAANNDGIWNESGTLLSLVIEPYYWQTLWFRLLAALGVVGGGAGIVWQIQQGRLRRQQQLMEHERVLAEEKARLASVLEGTTDLVSFMSPEGAVLYINPAGRRMVGLEASDTVHGLNLRDFCSAASVEQTFKTALPHAIAHGAWNGEATMKRRNGSEFPVSQVVVAHKGSGGRLLFLSTIVRDITERKLAEAALGESEERYRTVVDLMPEGIILALDEKITFVNAESLRILGAKAPVEVIGRSVFDFVPPELLDQVRRRRREVTAHRTVPPPLEAEALRVDGSRIPVEVSSGPITFRGRLGVLNVLRDMSQRRAAEREMRLLAQTLKSAQDCISITDLAGRILFVNDAFLATYGYSEAELLGQNIAIVRRRSPSLETPTGNPAPPHNANWHGELLNRRKDGTEFPIELWSSVVRDPQGEPVARVGVARDITERRTAEETRVRLEEQLRQSQKMEAIGQLAGGVAHDFNNILGAIMMQVDLARLDESLPEDTYGLLDEIGASASRAANLTRQLLLFSRRQVMQARPLDLNEIVTSLAKMLQRLMGQSIRIQLNLHPGPLIVHADAGMLDQILMNFAVNARDAMPGGGKLSIETTEVEVSAEEARTMPEATPGRYVCLRVSDTGTGIPPEVMPHIFEPFFTTKEPGKGTGLGLATVFGIVRQHQGFITVSSAPDQGTCFRILLPPAAPGADVLPAPGAAHRKPRGGTETILLVEDEVTVRMATRQLLEYHGYHVLEAANGAEALQFWEENQEPIHLLFTDMVMPEGIGGRELAERLLARQPTLKVLFTSGYSTELAGMELNLQEGQNFLQKPSTSFQLLETVRRCLDN